MTLGDVVNQFHDEHRLSYAGTTEETYLTTLGVRLEQVNHLDACVEHLGGCFEVVEFRRFTVNGILPL